MVDIVKMKIVGFDPAFRNVGYCCGDFDWHIDSDELGTLVCEFKPTEIGLIKTEKTTNKQIRVASDDLACANILLKGMAAQWRDPAIVFSEIPSGSQSATSAKAFGIVLGILAACPRPLIQVKQDEAKMAAVGKKKASKAEMIEWATGLYPDLDWRTRKLHGKIVYTNDNEHIADAIAVIHAGVNTDQFKHMLLMGQAFGEKSKS